MNKLFDLLKMHGGKIVSSSSCSELEIAQSQACGRWFVDADGFGFVYFPPAVN